MVHTSMKSHTLPPSTGLDIWHGFSDITHIKVTYGHKSATLNLMELNVQGIAPPPPPETAHVLG